MFQERILGNWTILINKQKYQDKPEKLPLISRESHLFSIFPPASAPVVSKIFISCVSCLGCFSIYLNILSILENSSHESVWNFLWFFLIKDCEEVNEDSKIFGQIGATLLPWINELFIEILEQCSRDAFLCGRDNAMSGLSLDLRIVFKHNLYKTLQFEKVELFSFLNCKFNCVWGSALEIEILPLELYLIYWNIHRRQMVI